MRIAESVIPGIERLRRGQGSSIIRRLAQISPCGARLGMMASLQQRRSVGGLEASGCM